MSDTDLLNCPGCGTKIAREKAQREHDGYRLFHCQWCDLAFWNPRLIQSDYYSDEKTYAYVLFHRGALKLPKWHKWFLEDFNHQGEGKKLLDIGCGNGIFLAHAKQLGYEVYGIDLDEKSIEVANEKYRIENAQRATLEQFIETARQQGLMFDVITFFEVLEHQADPESFLKQINALLKPGGVIAGSVPNRERVYAEGDRKNGDDLPPHHFLWFSEVSLRYLMQRTITSGKEIKFFRLTYSLWEYAAWLQNMFLGALSQKARAAMVKTVLAPERKQKNFALLDVIKFLRNAVFLPAAIITFPFFLYVNHVGWDLCFVIRSDER